MNNFEKRRDCEAADQAESPTAVNEHNVDLMRETQRQQDATK
jgi:hypothetical protein